SKDNFMCFKVTDKLTHRDYEDVLIPTLEVVIKDYGKARLLVDFGDEFHGMEVAAMWDDTKFGLTHRNDFERIAIVGGPGWSKWAARLGEAMMPCELHVFKSEEYSKALDWVRAPIEAGSRK
ncbi:MAG: STAS/SEC14 domain-containing protein, partial [Candidatus Obscuribacterales bacterium]|nr:STAS/SEC14 domain-containing protein [Candidatus Obscuribacterales bacterium]